MNDYPILTEMGIQRINEIEHFSLNQIDIDKDILKIFYKRKKGSVLPKRKTFRFGRSAKAIRSADNPNGMEEIYEISPFLLKALKELEANIKLRSSNKFLLERINELETDLKVIISELKSITKSL